MGMDPGHPQVHSCSALQSAMPLDLYFNTDALGSHSPNGCWVLNFMSIYAVAYRKSSLQSMCGVQSEI